jgi:hypothetical protein
MRFEKPSEIQASTLPLILDGHNVIAQAQSGAGECFCCYFPFHVCLTCINKDTAVVIFSSPVPNLRSLLCTILFSVPNMHTGKTIAFVIGMLAKINLSQPFPQALCLTPTRELANQILSDAVRPLSSRLRVTFEEALPGRDIAPGSTCNSQVRYRWIVLYSIVPALFCIAR